MKKTIMIVGAGFGQLPAIQKAKEMGLNVVVIDKNPNAVGMKFADYSYAVDVVDATEAINVARMHSIDGIMTMQTDLPIPTVGAVIDDLKLKGSGLDVAERCSNKIKTRIAFQKAGVPQPRFQIVQTILEAKVAASSIGFPCIIKSADSSGSRGVTKVNNEGEIVHALNEAFKYSRLSQVLVEEYISGIEIGAQGFSIEGKCECVLVHNDTLSKPPYMIPIGHSFPLVGFSRAELIKITDDVKIAVNVLGILNGPSNVDLIVDSKDKTVKIIEIGARIGATCLPELVKYHTGIDWVEQAIKSCLGLPVDLNITKSQAVTAYILQAPKDGILKDFYIPEKVISSSGIEEIEITAKIGEEVNILRKGTDRIGKIVVTAENVEKADEVALEAIENIVIKVE